MPSADAREAGLDVAPAAGGDVVELLQVLDRVVGHDRSLGGRTFTPADAVHGSDQPRRCPLLGSRTMGERTTYTPGTFSWTDLTTTDQDAAKSFYSGLFGWKADDRPVGDGIVYSMMLIDGKPVAAISPQPEAQRDAGAPPVWNSYVTVESADAALERAQHLGATVHAPAFDVMDAGRMGVDPGSAGRVLRGLGAEDEHRRVGLVNQHGALSWNELATADMDGVLRVLWRAVRVDVRADGGRDALPRDPDDGRPQRTEGSGRGWRASRRTGSCTSGPMTSSRDRAGRRTRRLDARRADGDRSRSFSVIQDPQGAVFALYSGSFDD